MQVLINESCSLLNHYLNRSRQENTISYSWQPMVNENACPCCSYTLLRHVSLEGISWRCSHCYQDMPVH